MIMNDEITMKHETLTITIMMTTFFHPNSNILELKYRHERYLILKIFLSFFFSFVSTGKNMHNNHDDDDQLFFYFPIEFLHVFHSFHFTKNTTTNENQLLLDKHIFKKKTQYSW